MLVLSEIFRNKLIPWACENGGKTFVIARSKLRQDDMPDGVELSRFKTTSNRVIVKNRRGYNNIRNIVAEWPGEGLHELNKYSLICVLNGHVNYPIGNYKVRCGPGHFLFIPPGIRCSNGLRSYVDLQKCVSCDIITFLLHPNAIEFWMSHGHAQGRERSNSGLVLHGHALSIFKTLMEAVSEENDRTPLIGNSLLTAFFSVMLREIDAGNHQPVRVGAPRQENASSPPQLSNADFASRLQHYIRSNLGKTLPLGHVAREMYLSRAQFVRKVRHETGHTFNELLNQQRIEEAQRLLQNSDWPIAVIAGMLGFRSASYFCTFFKSHFGQTPSEFRLRCSNTLTDTQK